MTEAERLAKLEELLKLPNELEWLEFKTASNDFDFDKLGEYFSALSNESNLHHQAAGWLVLGVDKKHNVLGPTGRKIPARWRS
jgi:ATP-dependent DNA helicase RecG